MNALQRMIWMLVGVVLVVPMAVGGTQEKAPKVNKLIIYPADGETVAKLKKEGVLRVDDYGSYWVVQATDEQVKTLQQKHGDRLQRADYFDKIELSETSIDVTSDEPDIPAQLQEVSSGGKRLRIVQFAGPIKQAWLDDVKAAGNVKLLHYVPHNAYLVKLDAAAEAKLQDSRKAGGAIQWIGTYHPYYKFNASLRQSTKATVTVRMAVINDSDSAQTVDTIRRYAFYGISAPRYLLKQMNLELTVRPADVAAIAALPNVLWIREVVPTKRFDEAQALVLATSDSGPAPTRYLDFLQNQVGVSQNPDDYPVVDIADTGLDVTDPCFSVPSFTVSPDQSCGEGANRIAYADTIDTEGHGTIVASVAAGFDNLPDEIINCFTEKIVIKTNEGTVSIVCVTNGFTIGDGVACSGPFPPACCADNSCTNFNITCGSVTNGASVSNICTVVENGAPPFPVTIYRREFNTGLQLGLGISPFGRIGQSAGGAEPTYAGPFDEALNAYLRQARMSNNSWGEICCTDAGDYDDLSQAYDALTRDAVNTGSTNPPTPGPSPVNQEIFYVFAGGNANGTAGTGGFGDVLVTPPATAKNVITVGASTKVDPGSLASFTSFGPTIDGRIKPDIMAPGVGIYGATSQNSYAHPKCGGCDPNDPSPSACEDGFTLYPTITLLYSQLENGITAYDGTSFSAPAVTGASQLLWWYFQNRLMMLQPSPAMMKAYLCNAARYLPLPDPLTGVTDQLPSIAQGMGRLDLDRVFDTVPRVIRDESELRAIDAPLLTTNPVTQQTYFSASGQSYQLSGTIADATKPFRVTLAWTDAPGTPGNGPQLVNHLNLLVTIGGKTYYGNVFDRQFSKIGGTPDSLNNMQSVFLPTGQTGTWSVVVRATNVAGQGVPNVGTTLNQDYALVVYNASNPSDVPNLGTNDSCQTAVQISSYPFVWTNNLSPAVYHQTLPNSTAGIGGIQEFFAITFPTPGTVFSANTFGSKFNTVLSVWRGTCGGLEEVTSNNDSSNTTQSAVSWTIPDTNTYYIVAQGLQNNTGKLVLNVNAVPPPFGFGTSVVNFGTNYVGSTTNVTVTLQNQTIVNANIGTIVIGGPNAGDFSITAENCAEASILPNSSCNISIDFSPTAIGVRNATLIVNDDITGGPHTLALTGFGLPQVPLLCASASLTAGLNFGQQPVGLSSPVQTVTITNCGTADMVITNETITGPGAAAYVISADTCSGQTIPPGGTCSFGVAFVPEVASNLLANLVINNNSGGTASIPLTGKGTPRAPAVCLSSTALSFGNVTVGTTGSVQSLIVSNCGSADLNVTGVSLTGAAPGQFIIGTNACSGSTIPAGGVCSITLNYAPTAIGQTNATLVISDTASDSPQLVTLTANGAGSQPDALISKSRNPKSFIGANVINDTGAMQEISQPAQRGKTKVFYVACQNDGNAADTFTVSGDGGSNGQFSVSYFLGAIAADDQPISNAVKRLPCASYLNCITATVTDGTYTTASLAPQSVTSAATMIRVEITVDPAASAGTYSVFITFRSTSEVLKSDTVKATIVIKR